MGWTEKTSLPERAVSLPGTPAQLCARESNSLYGGVRKSCESCAGEREVQLQGSISAA